jgi:hypothetical protein
MNNSRNKFKRILKEFRMAKIDGSLSPMKSRADEEFAKLIKGVPLNEVGYTGLDVDAQMGIETLKSEDGLDAVDILKALVYDVYHDESQHTIDMLKMMGYTDEQISSDRDHMGGIANIAAAEFIEMSDIDAETFLINYLLTLPVMDRSDDLRAIEMARQSAEEMETEPHFVPPDLEGVVNYLEKHGLDLAADYEIEGDNVSEPYYLACRTIEIGDHVASVLDPEGPYSHDDGHPFKGQNLNVDHHRMNVTWEEIAPTLREITRQFVREIY